MINAMELMLNVPRERSDELLERVIEIVRKSESTEDCVKKSIELLNEVRDKKEAMLVGVFLGYIVDAVILYDDPAQVFPNMYRLGETIRSIEDKELGGDIAYV